MAASSADGDLAKRALENFKKHFGEDAKDATLDEVKATKGGIEGWALRPEEQFRRITRKNVNEDKDITVRKSTTHHETKNYNSFLVLGSTFDLEERYEILDPIGQGAYGIVW